MVSSLSLCYKHERSRCVVVVYVFYHWGQCCSVFTGAVWAGPLLAPTLVRRRGRPLLNKKAA